MIPGIRCDVHVNVAKASYPTATIHVPCARGTVGVHLTWREDRAAVTWLATPGTASGVHNFFRDLLDEGEEWRRNQEASEPLIDQTAAMALLLPIAQQWLSTPVRRAEALAIWLHRALGASPVVH